MSYLFDTGDIVISGNVTVGAAASMGGWMNPSGMGQNNAGGFINQGNVNAERFQARWNQTGGSNKMRFIGGRATTSGQWDMTTGFADMTRPKWLGISYDGSSTANHPIFVTLVDGVISVLTNGAGLTRTATPSGAQNADSLPVRCGNNNTGGGSNSWAGTQGEMFLIARALTAEELISIALRGVLSQPRNLLLWWRMDRIVSGQALDLSGNARHGTATGVVVAADFPARYPVGVGAAA